MTSATKMSRPKKYKTCFVPDCKNTTIKTPGKLFFFVPEEKNRRMSWFNAAHRLDIPITKSVFYCCEDHFDIKEDMENYIRFSITGGPLKLKRHVVPHIFKCQKDRAHKFIENKRSSAVDKLNRKRVIAEILNEESSSKSKVIHSSLNEKSDRQKVIIISTTEEMILGI